MRGLLYLVKNAETGSQLKLRLMNVTKQEIATDLDKAMEFDQSTLFKRIYEDEYGTFGGNPFSCLIGDFEFGRSQQDIATLDKLSHVAAAAHAPFISAASPKLFDWDAFTEMGVPRDLAKGFETAELTKWRGFRESEDSRYVVLALPHVLLRSPYGPDTVPVEGFDFREDVDGKDHKKYLWGNAAYALAARVTDAFAKYHWCSAVQGVQGGGLVEGLPVHVFKTDNGEIASKCPTEIAIADTRENEFSKLGFIPLLYRKHSDQAAFFGAQSCQKPAYFGPRKPDANASAELSAQ